jgi:hypothetical protein
MINFVESENKLDIFGNQAESDCRKKKSIQRVGL